MNTNQREQDIGLVEMIGLAADLSDSETHCELSHGPGVAAPPAIDYITQLVQRGGNEQSETMVIPICRECEEALHGNEWTLFFCLRCGANKWLSRLLSRFSLRHNLIWLSGCPECGGVFNGLWFGAGTGTKEEQKDEDKADKK